MKSYKRILLILIFITGSFILKAQQNDSITQKLDGYLISANQFYKFNGSALIAQQAPQGSLPKSPLFAQDETNFYLKIIDARIEFVKDASGNISEFIAHYNGKDEVRKKVN